MSPQNRTVEQRIAAIAGRAHGSVSRAELLGAGLSDDEIKWRLRTGSLIAQFPGVYRVGHTAPSTEASYMAAVKACGDGAVLAGKAAAHLYGLIKGKPPPPEVITRTERRIKGIKTRRARAGLDPRDVCRWRGFAITTIPRTLLDLASLLAVADLTRAYHEAHVRHGTKPQHVAAVLARHPKAKGRRKLIRVIHGDEPVLLSELERRFLALLRENHIPLPETNRAAGAHHVDCRWPEHNVTVELDSFAYHNTRYAWEQDRERERAARKREDVLRRYTWTDVTEDGSSTVDDVRKLLS